MSSECLRAGRCFYGIARPASGLAVCGTVAGGLVGLPWSAKRLGFMTKLIPVLELEPGTFATRSHPSPTLSGAEDPQAWDRYWRDSLADSGITDLTPIEVGSWFVALEQFFATENLRTVLAREFDDIEGWDPEQLGPLCGGYVLMHDGHEVSPGCCGDLANLVEWEQAAAYTEQAWKQVWIGHPWIHVRADGDALVFSEPCETNEPKPGPEAVRVPRAELAAAVEEAGREVVRFADAVASVLETMNPGIPVVEVARILTAGHQKVGR